MEIKPKLRISLLTNMQNSTSTTSLMQMQFQLHNMVGIIRCVTRFTDLQRIGRVIKSMQKLATVLKVGLLKYVYYI